jgi:TrmH family RNA methyltransferase
VQRITSRHNAIVPRYRDVVAGRAPDRLLLDGVHLVGDALRANVVLDHVMVAATSADVPEVAALVADLETRGVPMALASDAVMDAVSPVRSSSPIVAVGRRPSRPVSPYDAAPALVVIACDIQDPGNLGAMIRVAEAAGASGLVAAGRSADPFGWKALRGSMGSALRLPVRALAAVDAAIAEARQHGARVVATVPRGGCPHTHAALAEPVALLIGGEGAGLPDSAINDADARISIPMACPVESLNAAAAAAVLLYEAQRQRDVADLAAGGARSGLAKGETIGS